MRLRKKFMPSLVRASLIGLVVVVAGFALVSISAPARDTASKPANPLAEPNYVGEHAVPGVNGTRYFCEPGSSTISVLGPTNQVLQTLTVTDDHGAKVNIEQLYFDQRQGQLLAITSEEVYAVDPGGRATVARIPKDASDPIYKKLELRQTEFSTPDERAAKQRAGEIATREQRGENLSAADKAYLDAYNGPVLQPQTRHPAPPMTLAPTDPAESARKEAAIHDAQRLRASGEWTAPTIPAPFRIEGVPQRHHAAGDALDVIDGCPCVGLNFEAAWGIPIPNDAEHDNCDPDSGLTFTYILVSGIGTVQDVNVGVDITHTWVGDLVISLEHNGTIVHLKSHHTTGFGEDCDNLVTVFDDEGAPFVEGACPHGGCTQTTDPGSCGTNLLSAFDGMDGTGSWIFRISDNAAGDLGTVNALSLCITDYVETAPVCACPGPGFGTGPVNIPIPDVTGTSDCDAINGITSSFTVPAGTGLISDVNVAVNLLHTWIGDLVIDVSHGGTTVRLLTHAPFGFGESCDNLSTVFDDEGINWYPTACPHLGCTRSYDPSSCGNHLLSAFDGLLADGLWTLRIADEAGGDVGTLSDWSVCFGAPDPPVCEQCPSGVLTSGPVEIPILDATGSDLCNAVGGLSTTIVAPAGSGLVQDVNVGVDLSHTFIGDLVIDVTHNGTTVRLVTHQPVGLGEGCDNLTTVFDDEGPAYVPGTCPHAGCNQTFDPGLCGNNLLSAFDGTDASGPWTLRVVDVVGGDIGTLHNWHLCLDTQPMGGFVSVTVETPDFTCGPGGITPNPFSYIIHATNNGGVPCENVSVILSAGAGPGGTADVPSPIGYIPVLNPGSTVDLGYDVTVTPSGTGGCIGGAITITSTNCPAYVIDFFCLIDVPGCTGAPGNCGCMDVVLAVDVTGSMGGALTNVIAEIPNIIATANLASGGDLRLGLVTFRDQVTTLNNLTFNQAAVTANIAGLTAFGGAGEPEPSDEALREIITQDALCTDGTEFTTNFRATCAKTVVLVTDARPGGCDDAYTPGVDDVNAHQRALDALGQSVQLSAVNIPTWPAYQPEIVPVMQDYANTSGGAYVLANADGSGTGAAIAAIIENCGGNHLPDDCLPEGPDCNGQPPKVYTSLSGMIGDAVIGMNGDSLRLDWRPVADAEFYQIYVGSIDEIAANYAPVGIAFDTTYFVSVSAITAMPTQRVVSYFVQAKKTEQRVVGADLACWPMDEGSGNLVEDFAQDNDGTNHGADWIPTLPGHSGLHFAYGDYVDVLNDVEFYGQPLQIEACVTIPSYPTIPTGAFYIFSCHRYATWFQGFGLRIDVNGRLLSEVWNQNIQNWNTLWAPPSKQVPLGVPFLVTAVINGPNSLLLLNGDVVAAGTQNYNSVTNGFHMTIGAHNYNDGRYQYHMRGDIHWLKVSQFIPGP